MVTQPTALMRERHLENIKEVTLPAAEYIAGNSLKEKHTEDLVSFMSRRDIFISLPMGYGG